MYVLRGEGYCSTCHKYGVFVFSSFRFWLQPHLNQREYCRWMKRGGPPEVSNFNPHIFLVSVCFLTYIFLRKFYHPNPNLNTCKHDRVSLCVCICAYLGVRSRVRVCQSLPTFLLFIFLFSQHVKKSCSFTLSFSAAPKTILQPSSVFVQSASYSFGPSSVLITSFDVSTIMRSMTFKLFFI